jgi:hypothetical protein
MVGKKSGKALQLEEGTNVPQLLLSSIWFHSLEGKFWANSVIPAGLERTDNGMKQTSWPEVSMINQKNYYTSVTHISKRYFHKMLFVLSIVGYMKSCRTTSIPLLFDIPLNSFLYQTYAFIGKEGPTLLRLTIRASSWS